MVSLSVSEEFSIVSLFSCDKWHVALLIFI